tara:strand:+ start:416 stop:724 length:309 start_codon:yes stop_codon:yes gene_type:complete
MWKGLKKDSTDKYKKSLAESMTTKICNIITFKEFKEQLIHYKSSVSWIDKYGTKHYMYGKDPIMDNDGNIDYDKATEYWKKKECDCYNYIYENKTDLLIKTN